MDASILVERDDEYGIATVIINRREKLNAMSAGMWTRLSEVMTGLSADDALRCIVIRGAGTQAFCPGADIGEFHDKRRTAEQARALGDMVRDTLETIRVCRHPTIAMIYGPCTGGGLEIAVNCDLRISGESGRFGIPINRIGVVLAYPEMRSLVGLVGSAVALEILLEGRVLGAREALEKGLLTRVVPDRELDEEIDVAARRIAQGAPLSNRAHKTMIARLAEGTPLSEKEYNMPYEAVETEDYQIGYRAFLTKETPHFKGK